MVADRLTGCRPLTADEATAVLSKLHGRDRAVALVCLYMGLRLQEALHLNVEDVATWQSGRWCVRPEVLVRRATTKGANAGRSIAVHDDLARELAVYLRSTHVDRAQDGPRPLFAGRSGRLTRTAAWRRLTVAFEAAMPGEPSVSTHSLRKTFATRLYAETKDLVAVQRILGHADPRETVRYLGLDRRACSDAVRGMASFLPPTEESSA